jgi:UbiD family decarboxylase
MPMSLAERTVPTNDYDRFSMRRFLAEAEAAGELLIVERPVELSEVAQILYETSKAVWFKAAGPEKAELVGNVAGTRALIALAFGVEPVKLGLEVLRRLENKPELVEVSRDDAPVQEVVLTGKEADLTALPVHLQHAFDGGPYISASMDIARNPATGFYNSGMRRLMLRGRHEAGVDLQAPSDLREIYKATVARGEKLPVSFVIGSSPIDHVCSVLRFPRDELEMISSLREAPLAVVKCVTNDLMVPADAEMILEGYFDAAGYVEPEGPYGEFLGHYGPVKINPIFRLTAITRRRDAIFQTSTISGHHLERTDTSQLNAVRTEAMVWSTLRTVAREPVAIHMTASSGGGMNLRIALRQHAPGEARNVIAAMFGCPAGVNHVFVVDPDVDVTSDTQMDWALATRFQADRDLVVQGGFRWTFMDPSVQGATIGSKAGFDCTKPFGSGNSLESQIPEVPKWQGKRFASIKAALDDGPKFFEELMVAVDSRDGREIVRDLEAEREAGRLSRDKDGRWMRPAK